MPPCGGGVGVSTAAATPDGVTVGAGQTTMPARCITPYKGLAKLGENGFAQMAKPRPRRRGGNGQTWPELNTRPALIRTASGTTLPVL